jgi:hypothetical protein
MTHRSLILTVMAFALAGACASEAPTDPLESDTHAVMNASIEFLNLEGGCWTIAPSEHVHYLPLNLPDQFRRDGLRVQVELLRRDDYGSVCMVGPVVQILSIRSR